MRRSPLKSAREGSGLCQEDIAVLAGVTQTYVSQLERGVHRPSLEVARRVAAALETSVDQLWPPVRERVSAGS